MPYRVLRGPVQHEGPVYVVSYASNRRDVVAARLDDGYSFITRDAAEAVAEHMRRLYPDVDYHVVGQWNARDWDAIAARYGATIPTVTAPVVEDNDDEDIPDCDICYRDHYTADHQNHYCESCEWTCDVHECSECVSYGPDGDMCEACAEEYNEYGGGGSGSPGLTLRRCSTCDSYDVHHDDIAEVFLCDCEARRQLADRRPVTLAHELPALEAVA